MKVKTLAFTLLELVVVVLVIGVLAAIGIPAYQDYLIKAKMAESYQGIEVLSRKQTSFYYENKEFKGLDASNPTALDGAMIITNTSWDSNWVPMPEGSHTIFSYFMGAGVTDDSGTELASSALNPVLTAVATPMNYIRRTYVSSGTRCNPTITAASLGAVSVPRYSYVVIAATADLNNDFSTTCTSVVRLMEASPLTNMNPTKSGFILFNVGE